jgi:hypothetical protein
MLREFFTPHHIVIKAFLLTEDPPVRYSALQNLYSQLIPSQRLAF